MFYNDYQIYKIRELSSMHLELTGLSTLRPEINRKQILCFDTNKVHVRPIPVAAQSKA